MEPTRLVIDIPAIPLTEALLALIACLLLRACNLLSEIARSNKQLSERSEVHADAAAAAARQRRPTPLPLAEGRAGSPSPTPERLRPIMVSAEAFERCLLGDDDDVQVPLFMAACKCYCTDPYPNPNPSPHPHPNPHPNAGAALHGRVQVLL